MWKKLKGAKQINNYLMFISNDSVPFFRGKSLITYIFSTVYIQRKPQKRMASSEGIVIYPTRNSPVA